MELVVVQVVLLTLVGTWFAYGREKQSQSLFISRRANLSAKKLTVLGAERVSRVLGSRNWSRVLFAVNESTEHHRTRIGGTAHRGIPGKLQNNEQSKT